MKAGKPRWRKKQRLYRKQKGKCFWCDDPMLLARWDPFRGKPPDDLATFEHLDTKASPLRGAFQHKKEKRVVLACYDCNNKRGSGWTDETRKHLQSG